MDYSAFLFSAGMKLIIDLECTFLLDYLFFFFLPTAIIRFSSMREIEIVFLNGF